MPVLAQQRPCGDKRSGLRASKLAVRRMILQQSQTLGSHHCLGAAVDTQFAVDVLDV